MSVKPPRAAPLDRDGLDLAGDPADDLTHLVVHEAGHAVVGLVTGRFLMSVSIGRGGVGNGRAEFAGCDDRDDRARRGELRAEDRPIVERDAVVLLAGRIAEEILHPRADGGRWAVGQDWGEAYVRVCSLAASSLEVEPLMNLCEARARALLMLHWGAVLALARALLDVRSLGGRAACNLVSHHLFRSHPDLDLHDRESLHERSPCHLKVISSPPEPARHG